MTILPKKNKSREQGDQENGAHAHTHSASRDALIAASGIPGQNLHHLQVHNRAVTQSGATADARKTTGYPTSPWSVPAVLDEKIAAKEGSSNDLESGPSQSKRRLRSSPDTALRNANRKQGRAPGNKAGAAATAAAAAAASSDSEDSVAGYNSEDEYGPPRYQGNVEELETWFEKTLKEKLGLCIKPMEPDGACLFRAVADQVFGDQDMHGVVRQNCIDYMKKNSDHFSAYVTEDFASYLDRKKTDSCHGNHVEMQAMSELYNRPVEVYQYSTKPINIYHGDYKVDVHYPIRISYHRNVHYNSLIDPYKATIGVGLGLPGLQPGLADKNLMMDATRLSEDVHIEETMLQDKIRETDWELTDEALQEQVARESYIQWLRDNEKRARTADAAKMSSSSAAAAAATAGTSSSLSPGEEHCSSVDWLVDLAGRPSPPPPQSQHCVAPRQPLLLEPLASVWCAPRSAVATECADVLGACSSGCFSRQDSTSLPPLHNCASTNFTEPAAFNETASLMNDIPPEILGVTDDSDDSILAQVMAQSAQEYMDSLKLSSSGAAAGKDGSH